MTGFEALFSPITIRGMTLKNRVIMAPMGTNLGFRNPSARSYYRERARGGVAALILGATQLDAFLDPAIMRGTREWLVEPVHEAGACIGTQLWHSNQYPSLARGETRQKWVAPSAGVPCGIGEIMNVVGGKESFCRELEVAEIAGLVQKYGEAAIEAREAGFDFVEIHGAHGNCLPAQFLSPLNNRRQDEYGGSLANRMRFCVEVARAVRQAVGSDYPLFYRLSAEEGLPGGIEFADSLALARALAQEGVDVIDVSWGSEHAYDAAPPRAVPHLAEADEPEGAFVPFATAVRREAGAPVVGVGRFHNPAVVDEAIKSESIDLAALGRQLLADAHWANKARDGLIEEIVPCLNCNHCEYTLHEGKKIACAVNPFLAQEDEATGAATSRKRVFVVGGGPAGLEAALLAKSRGHEVVLFERAEQLGGKLEVASVTAKKAPIARLREYLIAQVEKSGIEIRTSTTFTSRHLRNEAADAVMWAVGAEARLPEIKGVERQNVVMAEDVLLGKRPTGSRVAIVGGEMVACYTAEFLASQGKEVVVLRRGPRMLSYWPKERRHYVLVRLGALGVEMITGIEYQEIDDRGITITGSRGKAQRIEADTIVIAAGSATNDKSLEEIRALVPEVFAIGDCVAPREIAHAFADAARAVFAV